MCGGSEVPHEMTRKDTKKGGAARRWTSVPVSADSQAGAAQSLLLLPPPESHELELLESEPPLSHEPLPEESKDAPEQ